MNRDTIAAFAAACFLLMPSRGFSQQDSVKIYSQFLSPMADSVRKHDRIPQKEFEGVPFSLTGSLPKPIEVFIPQRSVANKEFSLLLHFLGASYVVKNAADQFKEDIIAAFVHLGSGSKINGDAFLDSSVFPRVLDSIQVSAERRLGQAIRIRRVILSGWSAGYGAVRQILSTSDNFSRVDAVLLLDGIHASYVLERKTLAEGGRIDSTHVESFLRFARDAASPASKKQFLITHSEIYPGTYASTTESCEYILAQLGVQQTAVLEWGPLGMQQISSAGGGHFLVLGFTGNTAPDHVDHFHALFHFLNLLAAL